LEDIENNLRQMEDVAGDGDEAAMDPASTAAKPREPWQWSGPDKTDSACPNGFAETVRKRLPPKPSMPTVDKELQDHHGTVAWQKVDSVLDTHHRKLEIRRELYFDALRRKVKLQRQRMKQADAKQEREAALEAIKQHKAAHSLTTAKSQLKSGDSRDEQPKVIEPYNPTVSETYLRVQDQYREMLKARDAPKRYIPASARYVEKAPARSGESGSSQQPAGRGSLPAISSSQGSSRDSVSSLPRTSSLATEADAIRALFQSLPPPPSAAGRKKEAPAVADPSDVAVRLSSQENIRFMLRRANRQIAQTQKLMTTLNLYPDDDLPFVAVPPPNPDDLAKQRLGPSAIPPRKKRVQARKIQTTSATQRPPPQQQEKALLPPLIKSASSAHSVVHDPQSFESEPAPLTMEALASTKPSIMCGGTKMWRPPYLGNDYFY
jgi:hypothetical protein